MEGLTRPVFLLSDYGERDSYAGQVRGVIAQVAPRSPIHDITHAVEPFAVEHGAWLLETALPSLPTDAVVFAVVDPGVGTARKAIVVEAGGRALVGPDNGLLSAAFEAPLRRAAAASGWAPLAGEGPPVRDIDPDALSHLYPGQRPISATFHGRDVFAPAAALIASGTPSSALGPPVDRVALVPPVEAALGGDGETLTGRVIHVDRYGNLVTTLRMDHVAALEKRIGRRPVICVGGMPVATLGLTFADAPRGQGLWHAGSSGFVAVAVNGGSAAALFGAGRGAAVTAGRA